MTECYYSYKWNARNASLSTYKKYKPKKQYTCYDTKGNIIEEGEYGEVGSFSRVIPAIGDSTKYVSGHTYNYKKLNTVRYYLYDSLNRLVQDELWRFKDNEKNLLTSKTLYEYDSKGKLEYNWENNPLRVKDYSKPTKDECIQIDSVLHSTYEGVIRHEGEREDTIINDSLGRTLEKIRYYKNRFLYRVKYSYNEYGILKSMHRYNENPDSLYSITEFEYDFTTKKVKKELCKVVGDNLERKEIYIYDRRSLLKKKLSYHGKQLNAYKKYKYTFYEK